MTRRANPIDDIIADRRLLLRAWVNSRFGTQLLRTLIEAMSRGGFELHAARSLTQIVVGMARQSYDLQLKRYRQEGWRATFYPAGRGHSVTSAVGSAWEREPWIVVQRATWESLRKREADGAKRSRPNALSLLPEVTDERGGER